jgi:hypothetical protein
MGRFGRALGGGIAKWLCDLDNALRRDETYWEREQRLVKENERREREQKKMDLAYKKIFGVYPNETWRW